MDKITEFAASFIPKNLPKKKARVLRDELACHLLDKSDFYKEIGYEESASIDKAIEEFGKDESIKEYIHKEFEELYQEKTIWGIIAGIFIWGLNILCFPLDLWVTSADFNRDPDPLGAFMSFLMIFAVIGLITFARIKKFRKMLFFIGLSNLTIGAFLIWCFYPQMATYSMWYNIIYLIDNFTPFISYGTFFEQILPLLLLVGVTAGLALYPLIASLLLKVGKIHNVKNPRKKSLALTCVCFAVMFVTCMLQKTGFEYYDEYPVFFTPYDIYISEETAELYDRINLGITVAEAEKIMDEYAIQSVEMYRGFLDKTGKKQLDKKLEKMDFHEDYKVYFPPYSNVKGQGFVGIKEEEGIVTGVAVGNIDEYIFNEKSSTFGYTDTGTWNNWDDMSAVALYISSLKVGDKQEEILPAFGDGFEKFDDAMGRIYSKRKHNENGKQTNYYRVYFYGVTDPEKKIDYQKFSPWYLELYFTEGLLEKGALYTRKYTEDGAVPERMLVIE